MMGKALSGELSCPCDRSCCVLLELVASVDTDFIKGQFRFECLFKKSTVFVHRSFQVQLAMFIQVK